jgi:adenylate cyclase
VTQTPVRKLAVLLHADVVGSTSLVQRNETLAHERIQNTFKRLSATINNHSGIAHEIRGDALVAEFARASDAVTASIAFQAANLTHNEQLSDDISPVLRIGIAMGEVVVADNTVTGGGVVLAQRLEQLAGEGGTCIQGAVYETLPKRLPFEFENLGEQLVKGFDEPVRVYAVSLQPGAVIPESEEIVRAGTEAPELPGSPSIAVLPFDNMSGDADQEYFSDGITEDIITDLSKVSAIFVVARNSSFTYKGRPVKTQEICADLGVRYVVEGSVRKSGSRVRITAQLIDGSSGGHIWADRYDGTLDDIFDLQDEVTCQIVDALKVQLLPEEQKAIRNSPTASIEAYDLYLKGRQHFHYNTRENLHKAQDYFNRAIESDKSYAQPYCGLADCYSYLNTEHGEGHAALVSALAAATKAIELSPELGEAHASLGLVLSATGNYSSAVVEFSAAVRLDPGSYGAQYYWGRTLFAEGKLEEAVEHMETAWKLSPRDPQVPGLICQFYRALGRQADLEHAAQEAVNLGLQKLKAEPENWRACGSVAFGYLNLGNFPEAGEYMERSLESDRDDSILNYNAACLYCGTGDTERAIQHLQISLNHGAGFQFKDWIENDSDLDPIRNHPEFLEIFKNLP